MKTILISIKNVMLLQAIELSLKKTNDFKIYIDKSEDANEILEMCQNHSYDILFLDIARSYPYNFEEREKAIKAIKKLKSSPKIVVFCDSNSESDISEKVKELKIINAIDAFFYETVSAKYMIAVLQSL